MKLFTTATELNKAIDSIAKRGKLLDADIHRAGVSCLNHIQEHGDVTLLNKLVVSLPQGARKAAFVEWALAFGKVVVLDRGNAADEHKIAAGDVFKYSKEKSTNIEEAILKPWYNFRPEKDVLDLFDVNALVAKMLKQYNKAVKAGIKIEGAEDAKAQLRTLLQALDVQTEEL